MTEKGSEPLMSENVEHQQFVGPPPGYPGQPNYIPPPQTGYVIRGQPTHQGYIVQPPPPYEVQYNNAPPTVRTVVPQPPVEDNMIPAILVTVFCFFPTGILAIMRASDAKAAASYGDVQSAERHNRSAKKMIKISVIAGIVCTLVMIALLIVYIMVLTQVARDRYHD